MGKGFKAVTTAVAATLPLIAGCNHPTKLQVCLRSAAGITLPVDPLDRQWDASAETLSDGVVKVTTSVDQGRLPSLGTENKNAAHTLWPVTEREIYIEKAGVLRRIVEKTGYDPEVPRELLKGDIVPSDRNEAANRLVERLVTCLNKNGYDLGKK
jgi:hypothetical protein